MTKSSPQHLKLIVAISIALGGGAALSKHATAASPVTNCNSSGPGSLRAAIEVSNPPDTDAVDLRSLRCGTISLDDGAITVRQNTLQIFGPGNNNLTLRGVNDRIFNHVGDAGPLYLTDMTLEGGLAHDRGGCITSAAEVDLLRSVVRGCAIDVDARLNAPAMGGAVYATDRIVLSESVVSGNSIRGIDADRAYGGALASGRSTTVLWSTVSANSAISQNGHAYGGAIWTGGLDMYGSTVDHNAADYGGGLSLTKDPDYPNTRIRNSTISSNFAHGAAAIFAERALDVSSATITSNEDDSIMAALYALDTLTLNNSIVAGNASLSGTAEMDIGANCADCSHEITGAHNLVVTSTVPVPPNTISTCPRLGPLAENGGVTRTHMPLSGSPVIDAGGLPMFNSDQRTLARMIPNDIGSVERNENDRDDRIFRSVFDAVCD